MTQTQTSSRPSNRLLGLALLLTLSALGCGRPVEPAGEADAGVRVDAAAANIDSGVASHAPAEATASAHVPSAAAHATSPTREAAPDVATAPSTSPSLRHAIVRRAALSRQVVEREPVDPSTEFSAGSERLYAFFEFQNPTDEAMNIEVRFVRPDGSMSRAIALEVPPSMRRYRTWAYTRGARRVGEWAAVAQTSDGTEVARLPFRIVQ